MNTDAYESLAKALDRLPGGFPPTKSRVKLQILRKIFSSEELQRLPGAFLLNTHAKSVLPPVVVNS